MRTGKIKRASPYQAIIAARCPWALVSPALVSTSASNNAVVRRVPCVPQRVDGSIEIETPVETVYDYWETLENLPQFMGNLEEVMPGAPFGWSAASNYGHHIQETCLLQTLQWCR